MVYCCLHQRLWFLLDQHHTPPIVGEDQMINYEDFLKVGEEAGPKCRYEHHCFCGDCFLFLACSIKACILKEILFPVL